MPDLRVIRPRAGVRIHLYPGEIADMVTQPEVLAAFTVEELRKIKNDCELEMNARENDDGNQKSNP